MLSLALAGKPNAGKSTFFSAATMAEVDVANYPFTTIDANRGVSHVRTDCPCLELDRRCGNESCHEGIRYVPIELLDVAGLVPGAHEGRGLGNQFLDELTDADAILSVVDASGGTDSEGEPVAVGTHDPLEEVAFVERELDRWLASILERNWESVERQSRSPGFDIDQALTELLTGFGATPADVAGSLRFLEYPADPIKWTAEDRTALAEEIRARTKPIVVVANKIDVAPGENVEALMDLDRPVVPATAEGELALRRGVEQESIAYEPGDESFEVVTDLGERARSRLDSLAETMATFEGTGVQAALDTAVYDLLDHVTVFPVQDKAKWTDGTGTVLPDAMLLPAGSTPRDLAYAVHSDIGEGYLHAIDARSDRDVGEGYELEEGDVIKIVSTAT
ncbi:MAG: redox-regulated ATPase YchF [Halodesulfurarchaeum sp.]